MSKFVLDSSAALASMKREPGADLVASLMPGALISAVNMTEIISRLSDLNLSIGPLDESFAEAQVEIVPFTDAQARLSGDLRRATRSRGLSLGDRACLALAQERSLTAVTSDSTWVGLTPIPVLLIRPPKA